MCGRIVVARPVEVIAELMGVTEIVVADGGLAPSWNVAPGAEVPAVAGVRGGGRRLGTMRWGLVPSWSPDPSSGPRPINARIEGLLDKAMFAESFARRRCLVVVDGFYEWRRPPGGPKQPYYLDAGDGLGAPLALAAIWDRHDGVVSCAVVTAEADENLTWLHNRMPVRVGPDRWDDWLDPAARDVGELMGLLSSPVSVPLRARPVSSRVNSARNDGPELVEIMSGEAQPQLL